MGLREWIVDEKLAIDHVLIKDQLSVIYLFRSYFLDVTIKISALLAYFIFSLSRPVSFFPIRVSIVGACRKKWLRDTCVLFRLSPVSSYSIIWSGISVVSAN